MKYLHDLRDNFYNGLKEFSEHPISHVVSSTKDFVKDYWDLGAMALAILALKDIGHETFGAARFPIFFAGGYSGIRGAMGDENRLYRNLCLGFAVTSGIIRGNEISLATEILNNGWTVLATTGALFFDKEQRKEKNQCAENPLPGKPLEILVE